MFFTKTDEPQTRLGAALGFSPADFNRTLDILGSDDDLPEDELDGFITFEGDLGDQWEDSDGNVDESPEAVAGIIAFAFVAYDFCGVNSAKMLAAIAEDPDAFEAMRSDMHLS